MPRGQKKNGKAAPVADKKVVDIDSRPPQVVGDHAHNDPFIDDRLEASPPPQLEKQEFLTREQARPAPVREDSFVSKPSGDQEEPVDEEWLLSSGPLQKLLDDDSDRVSLVAVGATGQGKSTLGNALATHRAFEVSDSFDSQTRQSSHVDFDVQDVGYRFVDTVGFFDTKLTPEMVYGKFAEFADRAPGGVSAFLFVEQKGRFSDEHLKRFNIFKEYVGPEALLHTILVFTRIDDEQLKIQLRQDDDEGRTPAALREVMSQVFTVIGVDSVEAPAKARQAILDAVQLLIQRNEGQLYSNKAIQDAHFRRQELQTMVDNLVPGDRKIAMEHAMRSLYNGSQTYHEVRGLILHATVTQEKEKVEQKLHSLEQQKTKLEAQHLTQLHNLEQQKAELAAEHTAQLHQREQQKAELEAQHLKQLHQRDQQKAELEADHLKLLHNLEQQKAEVEAQHLKAGFEVKRLTDELQRLTEELERAQQEHQRQEQEWNKARLDWNRQEQERCAQSEKAWNLREELHSSSTARLNTEMESQKLITEREVQRLKDAQQEHEKQEQEWRRLEKERSDQAHEHRCQLEEQHSNEQARLNAIVEREAQRFKDVQEEHERRRKEQQRLDDERCKEVEETRKLQQMEHQNALAKQADGHDAERVKIELEVQRARTELEAQCVALSKVQSEKEGAHGELGAERRKLQKLKEDEEKRKHQDSQQIATEQQLRAKEAAEVEQLQTLFASQQTTISQHRQKVEELELRGKVLAAALATCVGVISLRWIRR